MTTTAATTTISPNYTTLQLRVGPQLQLHYTTLITPDYDTAYITLRYTTVATTTATATATLH